MSRKIIMFLKIIIYPALSISSIFITILSFYPLSYTILGLPWTLWVVLFCILLVIIINVSVFLKISIKFDKYRNVLIKKADILNSKNGIVIIPVNEYFDTIVDDKIVSSNSLHGKFIKKIFKDNIDKLNSEIENSLRESDYENNEQRYNGNIKKYKIGTVARIEYSNNIYLLLACTHFNDENMACIDLHEYYYSIIKLLDYIHSKHYDKDIYIPLIGGSGLNRLELNKIDTLINMISIINSYKKKLKITIIIDKDLPIIDILYIKYLF